MSLSAATRLLRPLLRPSSSLLSTNRQLHTSSPRLSPSDASKTSQASSSSINPDEIAHFSKLSQTWWDERGEFAPLHQMNPTRMEFIRDKIFEVARDEAEAGVSGSVLRPEDALKGLDVLDVGCGGGLLSESLARMGANTLGIDASESNIGIARLHAASDPLLTSPSPTNNNLPPLEYQHTSAESLITQPKRFDVVCSLEVLEHVDNPSSFLSTCAELVKPGGHLFLSTISRTALSYALTILAAEDILRVVPKGTHTYSKFIKPSELVQFFRDHRSITTTPTPTAHPTDSQQQKAEHYRGRPWISTPASASSLLRTEAELRGLIYNPLFGRWYLAPKDAWGSLECNYIFWVRKPRE